MNKSTFNKALSAFISSQTTQRDKLQVILMAGFEQAIDNGNTEYLTKALNACINVRSLPTNAIKEYVKVHIENCAWLKGKDGNMVFKKAIKAKPMIVTMPTVVWYEHEVAAKSQAKPDMDVVAQAKALFTKLTKALEAETVKEGQTNTAIELKKHLAEVLA